MSFVNYPLDHQMCRVLSVSHSNSIHEVSLFLHLYSPRWFWEAPSPTTQSSRGLSSTNLNSGAWFTINSQHFINSGTFLITTLSWLWRTKCTQYRLTFQPDWRHLEITGLWGETSEKTCAGHHKALHPLTAVGKLTCTLKTNPSQVSLSWLAFFVPPEVISGRMVLLITLLLMLTHIGDTNLFQPPFVAILAGIAMEADSPPYASFTAAHIWLIACQVNIYCWQFWKLYFCCRPRLLQILSSLRLSSLQWQRKIR